MKNIILSIIIPTKNRTENLIEILNVLSSYNWNKSEIEIIIHDNSMQNTDINNYLKSNSISSIVKYFYTTLSLSQSENSNLATMKAQGEFLCFIGDDDCVHKEIINVVKWMKINKYDILINTKPEYVWSNIVPTKFSKFTSGMLFTYRYTALYTIKNCDTQLRLHLENGGQYISDLPQFYHGIVKKSILDKIFAETGTYFPGPSPDMAIATALTCFSKFYILLDFPLIISGKSVNSVGGLGLKGKHIGKISDISFLPSDTSDNWTQFIPFYWSGSTIYAESVFKSLTKINRLDILFNFNFNYLYAKCLVFDYKYINFILNNIYLNPESTYLKVIYFYFIIWLNRLKTFFTNRTFLINYTNKKFHYNLNNYFEVFKILDIETKGLILPWKS